MQAHCLSAGRLSYEHGHAQQQEEKSKHSSVRWDSLLDAGIKEEGLQQGRHLSCVHMCEQEITLAFECEYEMRLGQHAVVCRCSEDASETVSCCILYFSYWCV